MKKLIGLVLVLFMIAPVVADDVAIESYDQHVGVAWVVMDGEIYFCDINGLANLRSGQPPKCYKARKITN